MKPTQERGGRGAVNHKRRLTNMSENESTQIMKREKRKRDRQNALRSKATRRAQG